MGAKDKLKLEARIIQLERHLVLVKAESDGYASELLKVQKDCIKARKAGIREAVEWIEENLLVAVKDEMSGSQITVTLGKAHESEEWQAKLKEWGTNK